MYILRTLDSALQGLFNRIIYSFFYFIKTLEALTMDLKPSFGLVFQKI